MANKRSGSIWHYFLPCLPTFIHSSGIYDRVSKGRVASHPPIKSNMWYISFIEMIHSMPVMTHLCLNPQEAKLFFPLTMITALGYLIMRAPNVGSETCHVWNLMFFTATCPSLYWLGIWHLIKKEVWNSIRFGFGVERKSTFKIKSLGIRK